MSGAGWIDALIGRVRSVSQMSEEGDERVLRAAASPLFGERVFGPNVRPVVALTGAASFLGANLIGLLEEDPRIGRIVAIDQKRSEEHTSELQSRGLIS